MDYLLTAGADATIVTFNVRRETALHLAAAATHSTCAARLLDASVMDPSGSSRRLANIVSVNVRLACCTCSDILWHRTVHPAVPSGQCMSTCTHQMTTCKVLLFSLGQGARYIDAVNGAGLCALHLATLQGSASTVRIQLPCSDVLHCLPFTP